MFGSTIPAPLATPSKVEFSTEAEHHFGCLSVVMIARAKLSIYSGDEPSFSGIILHPS